MSEDVIQKNGSVIRALSNSMFTVCLEGTSHNIIAYISGNIRRHRIKILPGDMVTVEMSITDLKHGRIVRRLNVNQQQLPSQSCS